MPHDIARLHHVGHVVSDMTQAMTLYRRLGFHVPPPSVPALAPREGAAPEPFGAANTHAELSRSFVELVTPVQPGTMAGLPPDARIVPLQAPPEKLPLVQSRIETASAQLGGWRDRFEGLHILMFSSPDVDGTGNRLSAAGVGHGGVNTVGRPVETPDGVRTEPVRYLEIDGAPEGRVGVVADLDPEFQHARHLDHPNGARDLVEAVLCVPDGQLPLFRQRYERYLGRPISAEGPVTLLTEADLPGLLPGEDPRAAPALVAFTVAVPDIARVRALLSENGLPVRETARGELFVPADATLGAAVIFREV
ncbi:VOC family protein [Streptomyces solicathayae]|uniref:VOC family protein n=1 Tax=Streptomyces solicathayae TaxID=3081768 RepID=A0ABZ0LKU0_9ACTN|nr:VOC family protein [Streptomyces sp. HUAS YS2]WOX20049.1 VOC family protein [Streptomyces sp. HUAS YS2]